VSAPTARRAGAAVGAPRFGYARLLECLRAYQAEVARAAGASGESDAAMDRRRVLARLETELGAAPALLLARGFDRAYRRVVEGL
jgi:hypothetical protein